MKAFKEWLADPARVFNSISIFLVGLTVGMLIERAL